MSEQDDIAVRRSNLSAAKQTLLANRLKKKLTASSEAQSIIQRPPGSDAPLSFAQKRMWFVDQLEPGNIAYNNPGSVRLTGSLNLFALQQSINEIIKRHEALRTAFPSVDGQPVQIIASDLNLTLPLVDLRNLPKTEREAEAQRLVIEEGSQPFDLAHGPLLRSILLWLDEEEYIITLTMHHIVSDEWSHGVFVKELATLYENFSTGKTARLPNLPIQYADFTYWQQQWLQGEVLNTQLTYWKQQLGSTLPVLKLPTDRPRLAVQSYQGGRQSLTLSKSLINVLKDWSQQEGVTLFMTLLAVFKVLLYRYTGQENIIVGSPIANRNRREIEGLIGCFVNTLALHTDLSGNPTFRQLLGRVREVALGAYAHQDLPFEQLVKELHPQRSLSRSPLFQVMLVLQNTPMPALELPGLTLSPLETIDNGTAKFDLTLLLWEKQGGLSGFYEYNTDLYDSTTIERIAEHFQTLLQSIIVNPDQRISELPLLTKAEQHQLLVKWNNTQVDYSKSLCIHELFEAQVKRIPDAIALVFEEEQLTYRELNYRANQLAHYLQKLSVGTEVRVGICVERSLDMIVGILGILKAGGTYVPLDPTYSQERLLFLLEDTQVQILITQEHLRERLPNEYQVYKVCLDHDWKAIAQESKENFTSEVTAHNLAYVIYTSGSTGKPKGVAIEHHSLVSLLTYLKELFTSDHLAGVFAPSSICFDLFVYELFLPLSWGGKVFLAENALYLASMPAANGVTLISTVPSAMAELLRLNSVPASVNIVSLAGEAIQNTLVQQLCEQPNIQQVINFYGPTEATVFSTSYKIIERQNESVLIGRPVGNTQIYLLDSYLQPVPVGVLGELYIGGTGVARCYLNRPDLTAENFLPNPFSNEPGMRLYKTGDLACYQSDGNIKFVGRIDHQVKIRGFRIELGEIEAALSQHPDIQQNTVLVREDKPGEQCLVGYVVPKQEKMISVGNLRHFLKEKLPEYMVPSVFVFLQALPLTPNGKVNRQALSAPDTTRPELDAAFVAPRTSEERLLAEIWAKVLDFEQVGIHDNFFELGGHSLLGTQLIAKVCEVFQVELPLRYLFQYPTVAELMTAIAQQKAKQTEEQQPTEILPTIIPHLDERYEPFPLNDIQQAYWIGRSDVFELSNVATHIYAEFESRNLDLERFNFAWQRLIDRHDMLRAIVRPDGQQQILEYVPPYKIQVLDLRGESPETVAAQLDAIRESLSHQVLPCDQWPLFEIRASQLDDQRVRLHFSFDALIGDAWSSQIIGRELTQFYHNPEYTLPPLELSFRDYVLAELNYRNSEKYRRSLDYWQNRISTLPPAPELPLIYNPAALQNPRFERQSGRLEPDTWSRLKTKATQLGVTPSGILLAAFTQVLSVWSKSPRFTICLTLFNRLPLHPQINDIVGDFTSLTLLEVDNSLEDTFSNRVRRIQGQLWEDLDRRYVSGVQVLRELSRIKKRVSEALMPVVFTSTLIQDSLSEQALHLDWLGNVIYSITQTPQVFLDHQVSEEAGALVFHWDAVKELFPPGLLDDMFAAYSNLLLQLTNEEESWQVTNFQLLPSIQLEQRAAINAIETQVPAAMLHTLFAAQVLQRPLQAAVVATNETLTYEDLYRRSNQLGNRLRQMGAQPNTLVAIVMDKGWEQVVACLGILASGAAYLPINPELPQERRWHLLAQGEVQLVVTNPWLDTTLVWPENVQRLCINTEELANECDRPLELLQQPEDLAYVIYTSGSTGLPKGVMIDHRGAVNTILDINQRFGVEPSDRVLAVSSLSFDLSVYDIFGTLAAGGTIVLPKASATQDLAHWVELMVRENVTIWNSVPALMQMMVEYTNSKPELFPNLRLVLLSGDWIPVALPAQIKALAKNACAIALGGATEASIWSILYPIEAVNPAWKSIPYGKPMANQRFYVLNEALEPCPMWVPGQLYIGGIGLAQGYWRDEAKTAVSFITHPRTGERLYRTGDLGRYLPDGNIEFFGREDFQVKIGGYRIELGEIEATLVQHPAVRETVVMAFVEHTDNKRLIAYVVPKQKDVITGDELCHFLEKKLPKYMVPSTFIMLDFMPLTPSGKVDRNALPAPSIVRSELNKTFVAPQNSIEKVLAEIWLEILGLAQVSIYDNFFELGGNSLLATQLLTKVRKTFQIALPLRDVFEMQTIAALAKKILEVVNSHKELKKTAIKPLDRTTKKMNLSSFKKGTDSSVK